MTPCERLPQSRGGASAHGVLTLKDPPEQTKVDAVPGYSREDTLPQDNTRQSHLSGLPFGQARRMWIGAPKAHASLVGNDLKNLGFKVTEDQANAQSTYLIAERPHPSTETGGDLGSAPLLMVQHPYIERLWREDYLWPGALGRSDFFGKCAAGIARKWASRSDLNTAVPHVIEVEATFRDRSHLCSRLRQALAAEFAKVLEPRVTLSAGAATVLPCSLRVLLTQKAVVASFLPLDGRAMNLGLPAPWKEAIRGVSFPSRAAHKCLAALATGFGGGLWTRRAGIQPAQSPDSSQDALPLLGQTWLDAGAVPGGMTAALLSLGARVIALDRAPLDTKNMPGPAGRLFVHTCDARSVSTELLCSLAGIKQAGGGLVCDLNGSVLAACEAVQNLAPMLAPQIPIIFTLKLAEPSRWRTVLTEANRRLAEVGIEVLSARHFAANRHELTLLGLSTASSRVAPRGHNLPLLHST